jgi:hypothetical protein
VVFESQPDFQPDYPATWQQFRRLEPGVHTVASLLKRWSLGTHQGSVTAAHLDAYLDEFAFASTAEIRAAGECFPIGCWRKPSSPSQPAFDLRARDRKTQPVVATVLRQLPAKGRNNLQKLGRIFSEWNQRVSLRRARTGD